MHDLKFTFVIIATLTLCLVLACFFALPESFSTSDDSSNENNGHVSFIRMLDENGNVKLIPTSESYCEGSASAPENFTD